jgi:hypothetical protein
MHKIHYKMESCKQNFAKIELIEDWLCDIWSTGDEKRVLCKFLGKFPLQKKFTNSSGAKDAPRISVVAFLPTQLLHT